MKQNGSFKFVWVAVLAAFAFAPSLWTQSRASTQVSVRLDETVADEPVTGRVILMITKPSGRQPRLVMPYTFAYYFNDPAIPYPQIFGVDVEALQPGEAVRIDATTLGHPLGSLADFQAGEYSIQALLHVYTRFDRADGHTLWLPMDRGEGQQFHLSPGNLYSEPERFTLDPEQGFDLELTLTEVIPPIPEPADTPYLKRVTIKSELVSEFWGRDMFVHATVLLPKGYDEHPEVNYPVLYYQGHFFEDPPFGFPEPVPDAAREAKPLYFPNFMVQQMWLSEDLPRMIVVSFRHATPYYDDSYFVDSANNGPWGRALIEEVIPELERRFRMIPEGYARVMTGGSTGGWVSAALQIYHPEFFGGAWSFCPDPIDFREFLGMDIYREENAFLLSGYTWKTPERYTSRTVKGQPRLTVREASRMSLVLGNRCRSGEFLDNWNAVYGPVGADGYPRPLWDHGTGAIDREVARHWRDQGFDLRRYLQEHWSEIGPKLVGKLHFICGDMDNFYLNLAVYRMEKFLEGTSNPHYGGSFLFGRPMIGHTYFGYDPWPRKMLETMAEHITANAPEGEDPTSWRYP